MKPEMKPEHTPHIEQGDGSRMSALADAQAHLVLTSPPYFALSVEEQLNAGLEPGADLDALEADTIAFAWGLRAVWAECTRVLAPERAARGTTRGTWTTHGPTRCAHATCHLTGTGATHWPTRSATHWAARGTTHATHLHPRRVSARCAAGCHTTHLTTRGIAPGTTRCAAHLLGGLLPGWGLGDLLKQQHLLLPTRGATHATRTTGPRASR